MGRASAVNKYQEVQLNSYFASVAYHKPDILQAEIQKAMQSAGLIKNLNNPLELETEPF